MSNDSKIVVKTVDSGALAGIVWPIGWLFTIGFCHLHAVKALLALVLWPYYLGVVLKG